MHWIIRFEGTLTKGPNTGRKFNFADSWGGVLFKTEEEARKALADYREREPALRFKLLSRETTVTETEIAE